MEVSEKSTGKNYARNGAKYASLASLKLGYRADEIIFLIGSRQLFDEMVAAKWLIPVVNRHKLQVFDRGQLSRAWARILNGEQPPRLVRPTPSGGECGHGNGSARTRKSSKQISEHVAQGRQRTSSRA